MELATGRRETMESSIREIKEKYTTIRTSEYLRHHGDAKQGEDLFGMSKGTNVMIKKKTTTQVYQQSYSTNCPRPLLPGPRVFETNLSKCPDPVFCPDSTRSSSD